MCLCGARANAHLQRRIQERGGGGGVWGLQPPISYMVTPPLLLASPSPFPAFCVGPEAGSTPPPPPPAFRVRSKADSTPPPPRISYAGLNPPFWKTLYPPLILQCALDNSCRGLIIEVTDIKIYIHGYEPCTTASPSEILNLD